MTRLIPKRHQNATSAAVARVPIIDTDKKVRTGIAGLDVLTHGGLPRAKTTLLCGVPSSGKTTLALQFALNGCVMAGERGLFVSFSDDVDAIHSKAVLVCPDVISKENEGLFSVIRIGFDQPGPDSATFSQQTSGFHDLYARLASLVRSTQVRRVVFDGLEDLLTFFPDEAVRRAEAARFFREVTATPAVTLVTARRQKGAQLTEHGYGEIASTCVLLIDISDDDIPSVRRVRVAKYTGSQFVHGSAAMTTGPNGIVVSVPRTAGNHPRSSAGQQSSSRLAVTRPRTAAALPRPTITRQPGARRRSAMATRPKVGRGPSDLEILRAFADFGSSRVGSKVDVRS